jgi:Domain of unknown function (DUF4129)
VVDGDAQRTPPATVSRPALPVRYARPVLAGLLVLAVCAGVRAVAPAASLHGGPWHRHGTLTGIALEALLGGLLVALGVAGRRPQRGYPVRELRMLLGPAIAITMITIAAVMVTKWVGVREHLEIMNVLRGGSKPQRHPKTVHFKVESPTNPAHLIDLLYAALLVVLLAAVVACIIVIRRRPPGGAAGYVDDYAADDTSLRDAVEAGRTALQEIDDARAAIIACYLAMEASLAQAGTARTAAETPDELLARAAASGLVRGFAASRLTALFYEARFSTHPLPFAARDEARQALDLIFADLSDQARGRAAAEAAGAPR